VTVVVAVVLAALGACCYAAGTRLQHQALRGRFTDAVRHPRWLGGLAALGAGVALHFSALRLAPVTVVQPLGVIAVVVSVLWGLRERRGLREQQGWRPRVPGATGLALGAILFGTGVFTVLAARVTVATSVPSSAQRSAGVTVLLVVAGCWAVSLLLPGRGRCLARAVGAGCAYGLVPMLVRAAGEEFTAHGVTPALCGTLAGLSLAGLAGFGLTQGAQAAGPPEVTVACLTVVDPFVGVTVGVGLLGEAPGLAPLTAVTGLACWAVSAAGVLHLARTTPYVHPISDRTPSARSPFPPQEYVMTAVASSRPQRVLIGADTFPPDVNGAANFAHRLAEGLAGRGHEVHVVCPATEAATGTGTGSDSQATTAGGVTVHRFVSHRTRFHPTFRVCLPWQVARPVGELLDGLAPDVVHIQSHFAVCRSLASAARERGIPVVATNHFMPENLLGYTPLPTTLRHTVCRLAWRDLVRVFSRAQAVTAPTPRAIQLLHDNGLDSPALPVSCGLDLDRFSQPAGEADDAARDGNTRVLFVGRLDEEKNADQLLRALALLSGRPDVRGEIVGDGSCRRSLERLAAELGVADRVTFHGLASDQEVLDAYARCDVFCMPGTAELQSLVTMEAMAAGKPVVAADAMALPHLVRPGHNGFLFPPGDVEALAGYLVTLLEDRELRLRMGRAGREIVAGHDLGRTLTTFEDLYLRAAGKDSQRTADTAPATAAATATTPTGHPAPRVSLPHPRPATESEHRHDEYAARPGRR
jgi:glycosyltransferase involved in cell wall biosynthesis